MGVCKGQVFTGTILVGGFIIGIILVDLNDRGLMPSPFNALIGTGSALFVLGVSLNYKYYKPSKYQKHKRQKIEDSAK